MASNTQKRKKVISSVPFAKVVRKYLTKKKSPEVVPIAKEPLPLTPHMQQHLGYLNVHSMSLNGLTLSGNVLPVEEPDECPGMNEVSEKLRVPNTKPLNHCLNHMKN